jgi:cyclic beta-1,2-glucan synthetase
MVSGAAARPREDAIRSELFGIERLERHAESLATAHRVTTGPSRGVNLLGRVTDNARALAAAYHDVVLAVEAGQDITPAEEWFLDNYHIVDAQLRDVRDHLPRGYYRRLPKIRDGHLTGYPRVYAVVWAYVAHTDSRVELDSLRRYIRAYQGEEPLTLGELWAIAIHLRHALVENLRRLADDVVAAREARVVADSIADLVVSSDAAEVAAGEAMLHRLDDTALADAFIVRLVQRLRDRDPSTTPALRWLEGKLVQQGTTSADVVSREHQAQAASNGTVRHIITSMRWMSSIDWFTFVESVSLLDQVLGEHYPFEALDFATRDEYRRHVEALARRSDASELDVARTAARLAAEARSADHAPGTHAAHVGHVPPQADPGHYLLGQGRRALEKEVGYRPPLTLRLYRLYRRFAIGGYLTGIVVLTALQVVGLSLLLLDRGVGWPAVVGLGALGILPATEIAIALVHRLVAALMPPRRIPKLELADGVPAELRTVVAVPTLLSSPPTSRSSSTAWRCTTSPTRRATCTSPSSATSGMRPPSTCRATMTSWRRWRQACVG